MKGRLFNSANGWIMSHKSEIAGSPNMIPLHPDDVKSGEGFNWELSAKEGREIEFEIVDGQAKLIKQDEPTTTRSTFPRNIVVPEVSDNFQIGPDGAYEHEGWDIIFAKWFGNQAYSKTVDGLQEYLEKNYYEPHKR